MQKKRGRKKLKPPKEKNPCENSTTGEKNITYISQSQHDNRKRTTAKCVAGKLGPGCYHNSEG
jgi:hypothetical protein